MLGTPHGQDRSLGSTIWHDRVGPTYPFGEADRPDFAVITTVVPSPPPAPRRTPPSPRWRCRRAAIPSTGACSSNGARCTSAYVVTIPRSAISHDRTFCGSAPSSGVNVVMGVGSPTGSTTRQPATSASAVRVAWPSSASRARIRSGPAARCSPSATEYPTRAATLASPFSSRCNTVNGRSQSGGGSRGRSPLRQRGPDREDTDAARAGHPLARGRVDRIGAHHTVDVAE